MTADHKALKGRSSLNIKYADALWRVDFMSAKREHVDVRESARRRVVTLRIKRKINRKFRRRLRRVDVENNFSIRLLHNTRQFFYRENDARLIVGVHNGDDCRLSWSNRLHEFAQVDLSVFSDPDPRDVVTVLFKTSANFDNRGMFDLRGNDMSTFWIGLERGAEPPEERGVVALGRAGGKDDFVGIRGAERVGDVATRFVEFARKSKRGLVHRARIPVFIGEILANCVDDLRSDLSRGVIIEISDVIIRHAERPFKDHARRGATRRAKGESRVQYCATLENRSAFWYPISEAAWKRLLSFPALNRR